MIWVGKLLVGVLTALGSLRLGGGLYAWRLAEKLECPTYIVLQTLTDGVELRQYEPYLIAETTCMEYGFRKSTKEGFRSCAGYIFGKNKPRQKMSMTAPVRASGNVATTGEKMAMTAPVRVDGRANQKTKVSFVMGSNYSLKTLPKPTEKNVKLRQVPAHTLAVRRFSGPPPNDERVLEERGKIENALRVANLSPSRKDTLVYGYHDPFMTPNMLRRNEVAVVIEGNP